MESTQSEISLPPCGDNQCKSDVQETQGQIQHMPEGKQIPLGLEMPQDPPGGAGGCSWEVIRATLHSSQLEGEKMDGWMKDACTGPLH